MLVYIVIPWGLGENGIMGSESSFRLQVRGLGHIHVLPLVAGKITVLASFSS